MTEREFVSSIPGFSKLSPTEQIKRFCWYLAWHKQRQTFTGADVGSCFDAVQCPKPSSVGPFLTSLAGQKPAFLLKRSGAYALSVHAHEQFDGALGKREATVVVDKLLQDLPSHLSIQCEKVYLEEAITCFKYKAYRAAIVMTWNLAYDHLCNLVIKNHLAAFNVQLPLSFPRADILVINSRDDLTALKESQVLQVMKSANIISGSVHKILKEKLDRRNIAAHPSGVSIAPQTAEEFIIDLVTNVVLKL